MRKQSRGARATMVRGATAIAIAMAASAGPTDGQTSGTVPPQHDLVVSVTGIESVAGELRIAVFDSAEEFVDEPLAFAVIPVEITTAEWSVRLPAGRYAVAVIHDEDANGELNTNFLGMPRERYGFSNQARGTFGAPSFEDASFELDALTGPRVVEVR
ncbi:MAG: DUF2141 domain-containing protein [Longimicrobiales bacterium]|jgi:uncharacterized protein (DUF2141 family)|nr:DUF2141 domain-containing protein [Longimicrobiales bacterium]NCG31898.1 DUF2141 domain-containing protein [Pseudomonadota bacterium]